MTRYLFEGLTVLIVLSVYGILVLCRRNCKNTVIEPEFNEVAAFCYVKSAVKCIVLILRTVDTAELSNINCLGDKLCLTI